MGDDYWNKIILHNVDQFHKEQEAAKQRVRDNQAKMKQDLEQQVNAMKKAKQAEKQKEQVYMQQLQEQADEQ